MNHISVDIVLNCNSTHIYLFIISIFKVPDALAFILIYQQQLSTHEVESSVIYLLYFINRFHFNLRED